MFSFSFQHQLFICIPLNRVHSAILAVHLHKSGSDYKKKVKKRILSRFSSSQALPSISADNPIPSSWLFNGTWLSFLLVLVDIMVSYVLTQQINYPLPLGPVAFDYSNPISQHFPQKTK